MSRSADERRLAELERIVHVLQSDMSVFKQIRTRPVPVGDPNEDLVTVPAEDLHRVLEYAIRADRAAGTAMGRIMYPVTSVQRLKEAFEIEETAQA